ncbi:MAG: phage tail fiber protein [Acidimicrobiales bacterium]
MANLVTVEANALLNATDAEAAYTAPTTPIQVALVTVIGTATSAGTEVTGGSYARQTITFAAASAGSAASNVAQTYTNMPAATIVGLDEWDSAGTPVRRWFGLLAASKTTNSGDTLTIASGNYTKTLS